MLKYRTVLSILVRPKGRSTARRLSVEDLVRYASCIPAKWRFNMTEQEFNMTEQDDAKMCGICSEPFKDGEVAVQAVRWWGSDKTPAHLRRVEKFWAHAVCVFNVARETEGPFEKHKPR
jgi:hypothetical protein